MVYLKIVNDFGLFISIFEFGKKKEGKNEYPYKIYDVFIFYFPIIR